MLIGKLYSRVLKEIGDRRLILFKCGVYGERFDLRLYMTEKIFDSKELNPAFVKESATDDPILLQTRVFLFLKHFIY